MKTIKRGTIEHKLWNVKVQRNFLIMFLIVLGGGILNLEAVSNNGGRMPFFLKDVDISDSSDTHYSFNVMETKDIKYPYLTDIIHIDYLGPYSGYYSIGDFILYIGGLAILLYVIIGVYESYFLFEYK